jgi:hypothetical protein
MPDARPLRTCTRCGQTDDHPRDVIAVPAGQPLVNFHMDCHALLGCPICIEQLKDANQVQGDELRDHLVQLEPLTVERVAELLGQPAPGQEG